MITATEWQKRKYPSQSVPQKKKKKNDYNKFEIKTTTFPFSFIF